MFSDAERAMLTELIDTEMDVADCMLTDAIDDLTVPLPTLLDVARVSAEKKQLLHDIREKLDA